jgi:hypothetical protein
MAKSVPIYEIKVTLKDIKPPIWRRMQIKDCTLAKLHDIIQFGMGWQDGHLWLFEVNGEEYGDDSEGELDALSAKKLKLSQIVADGVQKFCYVYDFGDNWEHVIQVEKTLEADPKVKYPRCVDGKRACPPEDCGGPWGYADLLEAIKSPKGDSDLLEWVGEDFDPEAFDLNQANRELAGVAK